MRRLRLRDMQQQEAEASKSAVQRRREDKPQRKRGPAFGLAELKASILKEEEEEQGGGRNDGVNWAGEVAQASS